MTVVEALPLYEIYKLDGDKLLIVTVGRVVSDTLPPPPGKGSFGSKRLLPPPRSSSIVGSSIGASGSLRPGNRNILMIYFKTLLFPKKFILYINC